MSFLSSLKAKLPTRETFKPTFTKESIKEAIENDRNIQRTNNLARKSAAALPAAVPRYLLEKVPVVNWLPKYSPRWLINDVIAGLTVGVILVPQALAYAKIATIPLQDGLLASWLPSALYFIMGTSKDSNTGPTPIIGLLTAEIVRQNTAAGYSPTAIAIAISFSVGIYSMVLGLLKLGFLLEFVSQPVLTGFISAAALVIIFGQVPSLFGETGVGSGTAAEISGFFDKLGTTKPATFFVGISGMIMLYLFQWIGQKYGKTYKAAWIVSIGRNAIVIFFFTIISFGVNNKRQNDPVFALTGKIPAGLVPPKAPDAALVGRVFSSSLAVFIAAALEHIAIAKSFARRNGYTIDQSQELTFLGFANFLNSFFGGMAVGGAASRTAVNSESGVKSPAGGIFSSITVLISIFALTGALFWIPKATLSAIIILAVWQIVVPISTFYKFWKISLADFTASQLAFWLTLFVSAETGIEGATAFMVLVTVFRTIFAKGKSVTKESYGDIYRGEISGPVTIPLGTQIMKFEHAIIFLNAAKTKSSIVESIQTYYSGLPSASASEAKSPDRLWNELGTQNIKLLRAKAGISEGEAELLPRIGKVVLDLRNVFYMDTTGIQALSDARADLKAYAGGVTLCFVGLRPELRIKMEKAGWAFMERGERVVEGEEKVWLCYDVAEAMDVEKWQPNVKNPFADTAEVDEEKDVPANRHTHMGSGAAREDAMPEEMDAQDNRRTFSV